jgi:enoyl-CoA hydratase
MQTSYHCITLEIEEKIAIITLSRPDVRHALNNKMLTELEHALEYIEKEADVRVLIVTGSGERAFSAGADIRELQQLSDGLAAEKQALLGQRVFAKVEQMPIPVIIAVNGIAFGGGCELALTGDIILAAKHAQFGQPEIMLGMMPGYGATQRLTRAIGEKNAYYYLFTGESFDSDTALRLGLVQRVVPLPKLLPTAVGLAKKLAKLAPIALQYIKRSVHNGLQVPIESGLALEAAYFGLAFQTEDRLEGMNAFFEKRKPVFQGK